MFYPMNVLVDLHSLGRRTNSSWLPKWQLRATLVICTNPRWSLCQRVIIFVIIILLIPAHHPCNQDQQNHSRHPHTRFSSTSSSSPRPNHSLQHSPSRYPPHFQPEHLMYGLQQPSSSKQLLIWTKGILIIQCCIYCPTFYTHSESHHICIVDIGQPKQ